MGWPKTTRIKGLEKAHIIHICLFFFILSSVCVLPVYAQSELSENPSSLTGPENMTDGHEGLTLEAHLMAQESLEDIIAQNNDLEQTLGYAPSLSQNDIIVDGYRVTVNEESLPSRMVDLQTGREVDYEYLNLDPSGKETKPESQEDINMIVITSKTPPDIETSMTLCGTKAREAVSGMRSYISNKRDISSREKKDGSDPTIETKPEEGEAPSLPDLLQYGRIVAEMADVFESLQYELDNLKEGESKDSKAKVQNEKAVSSENQLSGDSIEARRKIYNKIYYTKIQEMLNRKGLSCDYNITPEGHLKIFLTPSVKK